jgi:aerobic carbon-monoxide dehydrogenase medium subunit
VTLAIDGVCERVALAVGGVGPVPYRAQEEAAGLVGEKPADDVFSEIGRRVGARVTPDSDVHASADYRREVAAALVRRALAAATTRARGTGRGR